MTHTPFGRRVYAVGGTPTALVFSGTPRSRVVFMTCLIPVQFLDKRFNRGSEAGPRL